MKKLINEYFEAREKIYDRIEVFFDAYRDRFIHGFSRFTGFEISDEDDVIIAKYDVGNEFGDYTTNSIEIPITAFYDTPDDWVNKLEKTRLKENIIKKKEHEEYMYRKNLAKYKELREILGLKDC